MAKNNPVRICNPRHIPSNDPKFHHAEIFEGVGKSTKALFMILSNGWVFMIFIIVFVVKDHR